MKHATRKTLMVGVALLLALLLASTPYVTEATRVKAAGFSLQKQSTTKEIVVSLSRQWLWAYERGKEVYAVAVMTGRPDLATPLGTYHVFAKQSPTTFYSPWPRNSPYWYPPTYINYALAWKPGGYFLHDATWHSVFGPGTNRWHYDPIFGWQNGSHGCVAMTIGAAAWLYRWAPLGTTVRITV